MSPVNLRKLLLPLTLCISGSVLADATVNFSGTLIEPRRAWCITTMLSPLTLATM